ncbi:hypothetical protein GGS20DRAFT_333718 [Poronia punctata]|nr:hypothetical protein GGS20DRAFT_333718 [Poronia punctata]
MEKRSGDMTGHTKLIVVLSTVFGILGVVLIGLLGYWLLRRFRRRPGLFNRGLTPIGDDEIARWKVSRPEEKEYARTGHTSKDSTNSAKIQYQKAGSRPSTDTVVSPRSFINGHGYSMDLPRVPEPAAFALAPNARSGLTDEMVPGDDPFVQPLRRQTSRLQKNPVRANTRTRTSRSYSQPESGQSSSDSSPSGSRSAFNPRMGTGHSRIYSSSSVPPQLAHNGHGDAYIGLSPPPSRRQDHVIGQALG